MPGPCQYCGLPSLITGPSGVCPTCRENFPAKKPKPARLGKTPGLAAPNWLTPTLQTLVMAPKTRDATEIGPEIDAGLVLDQGLPNQVNEDNANQITSELSDPLQNYVVDNQSSPAQTETEYLPAEEAALLEISAEAEILEDLTPPQPVEVDHLGSPDQSTEYDPPTPAQESSNDFEPPQPETISQLGGGFDPMGDLSPTPASSETLDLELGIGLGAAALGGAGLAAETTTPGLAGAAVVGSFGMDLANDDLMPSSPAYPSDPSPASDDPMSDFGSPPSPALEPSLHDYEPVVESQEQFESHEITQGPGSTSFLPSDSNDPMAWYRGLWEEETGEPDNGHAPEPEPYQEPDYIPQIEEPLPTLEPEAEIEADLPVPEQEPETTPDPTTHFIPVNPGDPMADYREMWQAISTAPIVEEPLPEPETIVPPQTIEEVPQEAPPIYIAEPEPEHETWVDLNPPDVISVPDEEPLAEDFRQANLPEPMVEEAPPHSEPASQSSDSATAVQSAPEPDQEAILNRIKELEKAEAAKQSSKIKAAPVTSRKADGPAKTDYLAVAIGSAVAGLISGFFNLGWLGLIIAGLAGGSIVAILSRGKPTTEVISPAFTGLVTGGLTAFALGSGYSLLIPALPLKGDSKLFASLLVCFGVSLALPLILARSFESNANGAWLEKISLSKGLSTFLIVVFFLIPALPLSLALTPLLKPIPSDAGARRACTGLVSLMSLTPGKAQFGLTGMTTAFIPPKGNTDPIPNGEIKASAEFFNTDNQTMAIECSFSCAQGACKLVGLTPAAPAGLVSNEVVNPTPAPAPPAQNPTPASPSAAPVMPSASAVIQSGGNAGGGKTLGGIAALEEMLKVPPASAPGQSTQCLPTIQILTTQNHLTGQDCAAFSRDSRVMTYLTSQVRPFCPGAYLVTTNGVCSLKVKVQGPSGKVCDLDVKPGTPLTACP